MAGGLHPPVPVARFNSSAHGRPRPSRRTRAVYRRGSKAAQGGPTARQWRKTQEFRDGGTNRNGGAPGGLLGFAGSARMRRLLAAVALAALASGPARGQLALPGASLATPAPSKTDGEAKPARRRHSHRVEAARLEANPAALIDKPLKLNGRNGELKLARGDDKALKIVKYVLLGEVVSNPAQQCRIDIVAAAPIEAVPQGEPDGLPRYSAAIPACPLGFDIVDGAVLVPAQTDACVFTAADCQASPSGLWGPDAAELDKDPKAISKLRASADRAIKASLRALERRDRGAA